MSSFLQLSTIGLAILMASVGVGSQTYNDTRQLTSDLFAAYDPTVRPVLDQTKAVAVTALMLLGAIKVINEKEQTISIRIYSWWWWEDELLTWTPSAYGNTTTFSPHIDQVWTPTLNLAGSATSSQLLVDTSEVVPLYVNSSGTVVWSPSLLLEQTCKMDMTKFPLDEHNCTFLIYSVSSSKEQLTLQYSNDNLDLRRYTVNSEWELIKTETSVLSFDPGVSPPFYYITMSLIIKRRPRFFMLNLLMPTLALSFLNILVFILPADSGEKVGYSITVLLSVMLMMGVTTETLPESSDVVPLITQFLTALTLISVLSVVVTVATLFVHHNQEQESKKKEKALSFIEKLKQKVALRASIKPANQKKDFKQPNHGAHEANNGHVAHATTNFNGTLVTTEDQLAPEQMAPNKEHLNANTFVEAMQDAQSCIAIEPPLEKGRIRRPSAFGQLFSLPEEAPVNQKLKEKSGTGGLASLWFRGKHKQAEAKTGLNSPKHPKTAVFANDEQKSASEELWKELSKHLDTICFWIFLTAWLFVTLGYLIAILT